MKACGQTMFMISCRTNSEAAEVLMLNPARFSSSAMVAVPPEDDDALVDAPLVDGETAMIDTDSAAAAMAANADRLKYPFNPIALPCLSAAPVTADFPPLLQSQTPLAMSEVGRECNAIATFFSVNPTSIPAGSCRGGP